MIREPQVFRELFRGQWGRSDFKKLHVLQDSQTLTDLWTKSLGNSRSIPEVDFSKETVVVVTAFGELSRPVRVRITDIIRESTLNRVRVQVQHPGELAFGISSTPFVDVVAVPKTQLPMIVEFTHMY